MGSWTTLLWSATMILVIKIRFRPSNARAIEPIRELPHAFRYDQAVVMPALPTAACFGRPALAKDDWDKPFIAICNSHVDIIPGHVHLQAVGNFVKECVRAAGGVPFLFNTIGVDDGIAMGHDGMKYSLPSRELIADCVETMIQAHCFDAMICIPNCDKIVPGMFMGAMRVNIPTIFVSGGPDGSRQARPRARPST